MPTSPALASGGETHDPSGAEPNSPVSSLAAGLSNQAVEQAMVSGSPSFVIPFLYSQFIFLTAFSWESTQKAGSIIWKIPVHPLYQNLLIRYFAKVFNLWAGGFDYKFMIAGTGFNGGKLGIFWLPPNKNPSTYSLEELSVFPYGIIDPKENEPIRFSAGDMRLQKAHWMDFDPNVNYDSKDEDFLSRYAQTGGWLVLAVINPLISSNGTKTNVNISVLNTLAEDFSFNEFVPPVYKSSDFPIPDFHFDVERDCLMPELIIDTMKLSTLSVVTAVDYGQLIDPSTGLYSRVPESPRLNHLMFRFTNFLQFIEWEITKGGIANYSKDFITGTDPGVDFVPHNWFVEFTGQNFAMGFMQESEVVKAAFIKSCGIGLNQGSNQQHKYMIAFPEDSYGTESVPSDPYFGITQVKNFKPFHKYITQYVTDGTYVFLDYEKIQSDLGESIVIFGTSGDDIGCGTPITESLSRWFRTSPLRFSNGQDHQFDVVDNNSNLPLASLRLVKDGFFTTSKVSVLTKIQLNKVRLVHRGQISHDSVLPVPPGQGLIYHTFERRMNDFEDATDQRMASLVRAVQRNMDNDRSVFHSRQYRTSVNIRSEGSRVMEDALEEVPHTSSWTSPRD